MPTPPFALEPPSTPQPKRRRRPRKATPTFKAETAGQLDVVLGCPEMALPPDHLARLVLELVDLLDTSALEERYSSLGRHGFHPRRVLAVWVYASLEGKHYATQVARALKTDLAYRFLSGGPAFSETVVRDFRRKNKEFFQDAVQQTLAIAIERGLIDPSQFAIDSVRLRAEASTKSMRTLSRSKKRLEELAAEDVTQLSEEAQATHAEKVAKHTAAVERCEAEGRTSHSVTNPSAGLLKFPSGAALPGHRVTVAACGSGLRFIASLLINAAPNDYGLLEETVRGLHEALIEAGMPVRPDGVKLQVAADPGYLSQADLTFAADNRDWVDILIHEPPPPKRGAKDTDGAGFFDKARFKIQPDGSAICPAGRTMKGPYSQGGTRRLWKGDGCLDCPLRDRCTKGKQRSITQDPELDRVHDAMRDRMAEDGAKDRYNQRIATVEPVFSYLQDAMGFRRLSSRNEQTVEAEILLKILAHNLLRIHVGGRLFVATVTAVADAPHVEFLAAWIPLWTGSASATSRVSPTPPGGLRGDPGTGNEPPPRSCAVEVHVRELFSLPL